MLGWMMRDVLVCEIALSPIYIMLVATSLISSGARMSSMSIV